MSADRIVRVEWAVLEGRRPRAAGSNARLEEHGIDVRVPVLRITTECGAQGWGRVAVRSPDYTRDLLGQTVSSLFRPEGGVRDEFLTVEYPLWDLAGHLAHQPVYELIQRPDVGPEQGEPLLVRCYDTTLYFDDLHLEDDAQAAELIADEARQGYDRGHRAFKIKVGRGARHLSLEQGMRRDVLVAQAVRAAIGPEPFLMADANNGWNLNLTRQFLEETGNCRLFWLEEPFHEDPVLFRELQRWMTDRELRTYLADGEGHADPRLPEWGREGLVDVIQYDIFSHGFTRWLATGRQLDEWGLRSAPHHYGGHYGNFVSGHLAAAIDGFSFVEWDEAEVNGIDNSAYRVDEGWVEIPRRPGFGIDLEPLWFESRVKADGFEISL